MRFCTKMFDVERRCGLLLLRYFICRIKEYEDGELLNGNQFHSITAQNFNIQLTEEILSKLGQIFLFYFSFFDLVSFCSHIFHLNGLDWIMFLENDNIQNN